MAHQPPGKMPSTREGVTSSTEEVPPDLFFQIYEVELGNAEEQVYVDFCPSYVSKKNGDPGRRQTFWQHFQKLLEAARLYAHNPVIIEALSELMLEQKGDEPQIREARLLDIATKPDELRRRFQRHYDDGDRNIVVNEKWERFQERYAQASERFASHDTYHDHNPFAEDGVADAEDGVAEDDAYSYESEGLSSPHCSQYHYEMKQPVPWKHQANAGAGVPPPYILAQMELARRRRARQAEAHGKNDSGNGSDEDETKTDMPPFGAEGGPLRRLEPYAATQVITHPYQTAADAPWNDLRTRRSYPLSEVEESLCQEVAALDPQDILASNDAQGTSSDEQVTTSSDEQVTKRDE